MPPTRRSGAATLAGLLLAVLTTGCRVDLDVAVDVDRNGGGAVEITMTADAEAVRAAEDAGADPLDTLAGAARQQRWRVRERRVDGGGRAVAVSTEFSDPAAFEALARDLDDALSTAEVDLLEPFTLAVTDDEVRLRGAAGLVPGEGVRDFGVSRRRAVRMLRNDDAFGYTVTVDLPGDVVESNATAADASTLQWRVQPGERVTVSAVGTRPGPPVVRAVVGATAGALVAGAVLWLIARGRSRRRPG